MGDRFTFTLKTLVIAAWIGWFVANKNKLTNTYILLRKYFQHEIKDRGEVKKRPRELQKQGGIENEPKERKATNLFHNNRSVMWNYYSKNFINEYQSNEHKEISLNTYLAIHANFMELMFNFFISN